MDNTSNSRETDLQLSEKSPASIKALYPDIEGVIVGAMILRQQQPPNSSRVTQTLILRRAEDDTFPSMWELPGGTAEKTDQTLADVATRELLEETGLEAARIGGPIPSGQYNDSNPISVVYDEEGGAWAVVVFMVEVDNAEKIVTDPKEHDEWAWITAEEVRDRVLPQSGEETKVTFVSETMRSTILEGFKMAAPQD